MTSAETGHHEWLGALAGRGVPELDLSRCRRLVVVVAHPDDETLGAGGLIASAAAAGVAIDIVVATEGEGSHPESLTYSSATLIEVRRDEVARAVRQLAPLARLHLLRFPDSGLAQHVADLTVAIRSVLDGAAHPSTWVVTTWSDDPHPDHQAAGSAARTVAADAGATLLEFPIWAWHHYSPQDDSMPWDRLVQLPLASAAVQAKQRALAEYRSQLLPLSPAPGDQAVVPSTLLLVQPLPAEYFVAQDPGTVEGGADSGAGAGFGGSFDLRATDLPADRSSGDVTDFFDGLYLAADDPWDLENRWYEKRKREMLLAALPRAAFRAGFEPGCATGVLTERLAARCEWLLATDIAARPLELSRQRLAGWPNVKLQQLRVPQQWPAQQFDLIVFSEFGYYCTESDLAAFARRSADSLTDDGVLVVCHWRHPIDGWPLRGDDVHDIVRAQSGLRVVVEHVEEDFRLEVLMPHPGLSVARQTGVL